MNEILLINKNQDQSSYDVIRQLKKEYNHSNFGHSGTLDPLASGLLVIAVGKEALKAIRFINNADKEYIATLKFGIQSDTGDITGKIIKKQKIKIIANWKSILDSFIGSHLQIPPDFSAKKINGKKAYQLAREGKKINLKPSPIEIKAIELLSSNKEEIKFRVLVSKGTYIRTLCEDIAQKSQNIGTMTQLIRTKVGSFSLDQASSVDNIKDSSKIDIIDALPFTKYQMTKREFNKIKLGQRFLINKEGFLTLTFNNKLVSVVKIKNHKMTIMRNFNL